MKDKYGREVTGDTLIADLNPEDQQKTVEALKKVRLGRLWYVRCIDVKK